MKKPVVFVDQREGIWLENSVSPILDTQGELRRYAIYSRDITERKQAEEKMQQYQNKLRSLSAQLSLAEEQERRRIASDLHDRIGQSLVISKMKLAELRAKAKSKDFAEELDEFRETLDQAVKDTRTLTFEISPPILYELGFEAAVEWLTDEFSDTHNLQIKFENDAQPKPLDEPMRIFLFKGVQELLVNIVKHANAKKVNVSLQKNDKTLKILIRDDGIGFDQSKKRTEMDKGGGFGLFNLRDRLDYYGGKFEVESEPGKGTEVTLVAPLKSLK